MKLAITSALLALLCGCASIASMPLARDAPEGATALCHDGVFSFARSGWDACSQHSGVESWVRASGG